LALNCSASSAVKTICPTAAPGEAGRPLPSTRPRYPASSANWRREAGSAIVKSPVELLIVK
jgi:hypothetical protein